ncbi:unnamed protein product [Echinostoma caproni]|uniref:DUF7083 domain-containing protein n=1 Tax=Echinostoma caproni TaxID=27848 RepID=A0A183AXF3_9TREM|nr:unnamed protein product [Echinostoma caproni]
MIEIILQRLSSIPNPTKPVKQSISIDAVAAMITEFVYGPDAGTEFDSWFKRWEDVFRFEFADVDGGWMVRLLFRELGIKEHDRYRDMIPPKSLRDFTFEETVQQLSDTFGEKASLFNIRYQCLKLAKNDTDDYVTLASIVNREYEKFKLCSMTDDQFKFLIFLSALQSPLDAEIRTRFLNRIEQNPNINFWASGLRTSNMT